MLYAFLRPMLFRLDGETAHRLTVKAMTLLPSGTPDAEDAALASTVAGLRFPNPVGLAAGFDQDGARTSVVEGKSGSVRLALGGRPCIQKKQHRIIYTKAQ